MRSGPAGRSTLFEESDLFRIRRAETALPVFKGIDDAKHDGIALRRDEILEGEQGGDAAGGREGQADRFQ